MKSKYLENECIYEKKRKHRRKEAVKKTIMIYHNYINLQEYVIIHDILGKLIRNCESNTIYIH